jgi:hypothetical protein
MAQIKKLSVATVYGKINLKKLIEAGELPIMRVMGAAVGSKEGVSSYGDWKCLLGQFEAVNADTGEVFNASTLFLPEVAITPILVALSHPDCKGIEFAIEVHAKYIENAPSGGSPYEYTWVPLLPPDANDPITRVKARLLALANGNEGDDTPPALEDHSEPAKKAAKPAARRR